MHLAPDQMNVPQIIMRPTRVGLLCPYMTGRDPG
jgi:hypothetical protein